MNIFVLGLEFDICALAGAGAELGKNHTTGGRHHDPYTILIFPTALTMPAIGRVTPSSSMDLHKHCSPLIGPC